MTPQRGAELVLTIIIGVIVISLLAGQLFGQPILLGFVETGSMAPTLSPGDGFVAIPSAIAGPIEPGDVIVFRAEVLDGGGLTTHRVVGESEQGFITRGDANVVTDQDSGEPPVQRAQIVAEALQIGGHVVVIPGLGAVVLGIQGFLTAIQRAMAQFVGSTALLGTQGLAYLIFAFGVLAYIVTIVQEHFADGEGRSRIRVLSRDEESMNAGMIVLALTLLLVATLTGTMVGTGGTQTFNVVSASTDSERPYVIKTGTTESFTYIVPSYGVLPAMVFLEPGSDRISVAPDEVYIPSGGSSENVTVTLTAPPQTGHYPQYLIERRYIAILPLGIIRGLYHTHPWLPVLAIDAFVGIGFAGIGWALIGTGRIRFRSRTAELTWEERIRRLFR